MKKFLLSLVALFVGIISVHAEEATLSFADKANRTTFTTSQQVWAQNGVVLTNNKAKSKNDVADYAKPGRFYKDSQIIVECEFGNIEKIVFDCNNASYATALNSSIGTAATTAVNADKVTVVLDGTSNTFEIAQLSGGQVRMDALTVTYSAEGEDEEKPVVTSIALTESSEVQTSY